jgi:hypothetical protein
MRLKKYTFLLICALLLSSCGSLPDLGLGGYTAATETLYPEEIIIEATKNNHLTATSIPEITSLPEASATPDTVHFRDEFEKDINENWDLNVISGLENQLEVIQENGELHVTTLPPNDVNFIFTNNKNTYKDVIVTAEVKNSGQLGNAFSLICRASESGWYEFRISSNYYYELLRYDSYKQGDGSNPYTNFLNTRIGTPLIKSGFNKNSFSLSCVGNEIAIFINDIQVYRVKRPVVIEDSTYSEGTIGFGFLGYGKTLEGIFDWIETKKP